jgi:hypothetical protein
MTRSGPLIPGGSASYTLTVTNNGINSEPGPISVVDTLPAGLTYNATGSGGTGWVCGAVGQVVTCTRAGALAAGATAAALTVNVNVSAGATGTITNTATVSGTGGDGNTANNTAVDSYTIPIQAYAYYAMDETSWGAVIDSSGNGRDGTVLGAATPTGYPPPSPPGSAIAGNPGTCGAGAIPVTAGTQAVDTGIDVNSIGNAGTIAFWYNGNAAWNDGNARMLFDASNELGNGGADKHFYLVKEGSGRLRFAFEDSNDNNYQARSGGNSFPAGEWHHIAVTWDMGADRARLYLDGVQVAQSGNTSGTLGNTATLYLGDQRFGTIGGAPGYTANSANGYLDEVHLYASALNAADITAVMNASHSCVALDHYAISHSGTGVNCQAEPVTVTAHDATHNPIALTNATTITLSTSTGLGDWSLTTGLGILNNGTANDGIATYQFGAESSALLALKHTTPAPSPGVNINVTDGTATETSGAATAGEDAGLIFAPSGFRYTDGTNPVTIGTQISAKPSNVAPGAQSLYLQAIRTDTNTGACVGVFPSGTSVNVDMASQCNNPTTCTAAQVSITNNAIATALAGNPNTGVSSYTSVPLLFGANSQAQFSFTYPDAGSTSLHARYNIPLEGGGASPDTMFGSSNAFVVRPFGFRITDPPSGRTGGGSAVFTTAGTPFNTTLAAVVWEAADDIDNDGVPDNQGALAANAATPNFGRETTPATATLSHALAEPVGGAPGTLSGTTTFSGFSTGASTQSVAFSEVGIIDLLAQTTNYLGSGQNITAGASGLTGVGRFIPHHFDVTKIHGCTGGATFTYSGQPFATLTATARNLAGVTTSNYRDFGGGVVFSKDTTVSNAGATANFTNNVIAASSFANGIGNQNTVTYTFPTPPGKDTVPLTLTLRAVDNDSVSSAGFTEETAEIRSGRLRIINAYGSELAALPVPMRVEYYSGDGWITNLVDTCTSVLAASLSLSNTSAPSPVSPPTQKKMNDTSASTTGASVANSPFLNGDAGLSFSAPGAGGDGYVDVIPDLSAKTWLRYDWDDNGSLDDPTGRATFGLYRGSPRHIYQRERY